jgi:DNA-binding IclR family transcriptional regulator
MVAALSISGPAFRLPDDELAGSLVPTLQAAAVRLSRQLGFGL